MLTALITSGSIFAYVMLMQLGRRRFRWHSWLPAAAAIPIVIVVFVRKSPTQAADLAVYGMAAIVGICLGMLAAGTTRVERDQRNRLITRCGAAFALVWFIALGARVGFVWALSDVPGAGRLFTTFLATHRLTLAVIAPAWILISVAMYLVRIASVPLRALHHHDTQTDADPHLEPANTDR